MVALLIVVYSICGVYMLFDFKHDIHMLQQNSYRIKRYWRYLIDGDTGSLWRLSDLAMLFIVCSHLLPISVASVFTATFCLVKFILIQRKTFKKPLVFTKRVWRIYCVSSTIFIGLFLWVIFKLGFSPEPKLFYSGPTLTLVILLLFSIFSWAVVIMAVIILMPVEKHINNRYIGEAKHILKGMKDLKVIGITGSYGKTSTKHFLNRILSEKFDVLMTPGSFNTPMGVVRTIREYLKPYHTYFICEMGAKQRGDIKEICDIVHPVIGVVTAVGPMHLETFKTVSNVRDTKFELIDSLPKDGYAVINNDFEESATRKVNNVQAVRYSTSGKTDISNDYSVEDIKYTSEGTDFSLKIPEGEKISFHTRLLGEANVSDLAAAIIVALNTGMTYEEIKRGVEAIEPVEHRLSTKNTPGGFLIIDDAFNSNPVGSKMALEVLGQFKTGKRIVVTPGMIELGESQFDLNEKLGEVIAENVDLAIIVGLYNREAISLGLSKAGYPEEKIYFASDFNDAQMKLSSILQPGDTVLYENDLPDTFK